MKKHKLVTRRGGMSDRERLNLIEKIAADMAQKITTLVTQLAKEGKVVADMQDLIYQAGYIEGLSYVPEELK